MLSSNRQEKEAVKNTQNHINQPSNVMLNEPAPRVYQNQHRADGQFDWLVCNSAANVIG